MPFQQFNESRVINQTSGFVAGSGTGLQALFNALTSGGGRVNAIIAINVDSIAHVVRLMLTQGSTNSLLGSASVPAGQGTAGTPGLDILALILGNSNGLELGAGDSLSAEMEVAVTGGNYVILIALGAAC